MIPSLSFKVRVSWIVIVLLIFSLSKNLKGKGPVLNYEVVKQRLENKLKSGDFPGIQYVVIAPQGTVFQFSGGYRDIQNEKFIDANTTMMAYSMTKIFTAVAVLQLIERGTISLDDSLSQYFEKHPYGKEIKIRHLLAQTSGIPNPIPLKWVHLSDESPGFHEDLALKKVLEDNPKLKSKPGDKYAYSNISYWLLGKVIESVSGESYPLYMKKNIFSKLGLSEKQMSFQIENESDHAKGYLKKYSMLNLLKGFLIEEKYLVGYEGNWLHVKNHYLNGPSFGGIVSSAESISVFLSDLLQDNSKVLSRNGKSLFFTQQKNNAGYEIPMTLGWHTKKSGSWKCFFKEGGGGGFHSEMRIYPEKKIASVVIANSTTFDASLFLDMFDKELIVNQ